jgi:Phosphate-selective porin
MLFWALSAVVGAPQLVAQQDSAAEATQQRLDDLDQQIKVLSRRWELYHDSVINAAKSRPSVTAGATGFQLKSADGNFVLKLRGYLQTDARVYLSDDAQVLTNDLLLRRVRPILEGTVYKYYDFRIMPDFAGAAPTIFDAYFEARFKPEFAVRAGKYKPALGLERYQSATDVKFIERGLPTNLVPSRDVGLQVAGDLAGGILNYNAALFDGVPDLASGLNDVADGKDLVGRLFIVPFAKKADNPRLISVSASPGAPGMSSATSRPRPFLHIARPARPRSSVTSRALRRPSPGPSSPTGAGNESFPKPTSTKVPWACSRSTPSPVRRWLVTPVSPALRRSWSTRRGRWRVRFS